MKRLLTVALLGLFLASTTIGCGGEKKDGGAKKTDTTKKDDTKKTE